MRLRRAASTALQVAVIVLISLAASHIFQRVDVLIQVNGVHAYRYIGYCATIVLGYICVSKYNKYLAFSLSSALLVLAILGQERAIDAFPAIAPFFATLMGLSTVLSTAAKGNGFAAFLFTLILPAILAQSRIGGSIMSIPEGVFTYEVYAVTIAVVGGYFYLRYRALTDLMHQELLSRGANERDTSAISRWNNFVTGTIVASATATTAVLATATSFLRSALQPYFAMPPLHIFLIEITIGTIVAALIYHFQTLAGKT